MESIIKDFGIQPILLAAQVVNFLVLLLILKKFLYKPILKVLDERKKRIAQSLLDAQAVEEKLAKTEEDKEKVLEKASLEAKKIIEEATKSANQIIEEAHLKAQQDIEILMVKNQQALKLEKEKMQQDIKQELADLITTSLEKVLEGSLTKQDSDRLINKAIKDF